MAGTKSDRDSKEEIAQGMSEAGKGEKGKVHGEAGKGQHGHGADPDKLGQGMSEAGSDGAVPNALGASGTDRSAGCGLSWFMLFGCPGPCRRGSL